MGKRFGEDVGAALPNALTLARLPLAAVFWIAPSSPPFAFTVLGLAALTDVLDGWLARRWRAKRWREDHDPGAFAAGTGRGPWLDALCDKIFVVSVLAAVGMAVRPPIHLLVVIAAREILMIPLTVAYRAMPESFRRDFDVTAGWPGKLATVLQFAAVALAILESPLFETVAWASGAAGLAAVLYYVRRAYRTTTSSRTSDRPRRRARG